MATISKMSPELARFLIGMALNPADVTAFKALTIAERQARAEAAGLSAADAQYASNVIHGRVHIEAEVPPSQATQQFTKFW